MKIKLSLCLLLLTSVAGAQDITFARKMIDTLTSPYFWGRGYTKNGMAKAGDFLAAEFKSYGLKPMNGKTFFQPYNYPVNTYPGKMEVTLNGTVLVPGRDFIIRPDTKGVTGEGNLVQTDSIHFQDDKNRIIVELQDKLTWSAEQTVADYTVIQVDKKWFKDKPTSIKTNIESEFIKQFKANNICGVVKGTIKPDSVIMFTAHYDHLGGMGDKVYFPGANDNASGVTEVLTMAKYYAAHPQPYTMAFVLFSGEEAGLLGSKYFSVHPLVPLHNVRFLINLDLEGTGIDGVTVVNATVYPKEFALLRKINDQYQLLPKVNSRGQAANSDHYWFTESGVPSFFMYTLGGIKAYHDIYDISTTLPLTKYEQLFTLLTKFSDGLMGK